MCLGFLLKIIFAGLFSLLNIISLYEILKCVHSAIETIWGYLFVNV